MSATIACAMVQMNQQEQSSRIELREEYSRLAREWAPSLIRIARRLCPHDEDTAQDLVQHALVTGYEKLHTGDLTIGQGTLKWLIRAMTNEFLQRLRKDKRVNWSSEAGHEVESNSPDANAVLVQNEEKSLIEDALQGLTPEHRACLVLVDLQEYNYQEAADVLDIPVGTVRSRLSRARLKMAEQITILKERGQA